MAETVVTFLAAHELSMYAAAFDEHGWDSLSALRDISDADLVQLEKDVAIKSGHSSRLRRALGKVVAPAAPAVPAAPAAPPPATQEAEHDADPAQAEVPPSQAAAGVAGGADAGADATAAATGDAAAKVRPVLLGTHVRQRVAKRAARLARMGPRWCCWPGSGSRGSRSTSRRPS